MKKLFFITLVAGASLFFTNNTNAQVGLGGFPKSMTLGSGVSVASSTITLERPDYEKLSKEDAERGGGTMYRGGITLPAHIDFHKSGTWTYLDNGEKIWKLTVEVPNAMGVVLMYENYHLPKGVTLYLSNENGKQVLGAYTEATNPKTDFYSNEPVIGSKVNIEMNFTPDASVEDVKYTIKYAAAIYRGLEREMQTFDQTMDNPIYPGSGLGTSAACHVNAICPSVNGWEIQRKSVARILISPNAEYQGVGWCSGTLINNTGNTTANCKPLFATASHCDGENGWTDAHFQYWQFRFDYLSANCDGSGLPTGTNSATLTNGGKFVSRSYYPSMAGNPDHPSLVQDFLMLELNDGFTKIPNAYLAGWNRKDSYTQADFDGEYSRFLGLHHPGGDMMKASANATIGNARFNQSVVSNTHWLLSAASGGSAGGSSGSSLFDINGRSIGVLSGGPGGTCPTDGRDFGQSMSYSKFSYGWENPYDQTTFPDKAGPQSRLKEVLDPIGSGTTYISSTPVSECDGTLGSSSIRFNRLADNIFTVFPNPSKDGNVEIRFNFANQTDVRVVVYNTIGQEVKSVSLSKVSNQSFNLGLGNVVAGLYTVKVIADNQQLSKMISITK